MPIMCAGWCETFYFRSIDPPRREGEPYGSPSLRGDLSRDHSR